ncbi:MAG: 30S ribosomal protein S9 [Nitrospinae bacterium]|nr:30S ribosomal protein S9 [Nitrospinota bacterium]
MADVNETSPYATGRRKTSTARVWVRPGAGKILVNELEPLAYFKRETSVKLMRQPLELVNVADKVDVVATVKGGGLHSQAGAVRHGISRALLKYDAALRGRVKKAGMLTRDSRMKERKKPGQAAARKRFQFSKR